MQKRRSPRIIDHSWGHMEVESVGAGKDFKLHPGGGRGWDWRETNTEHVPGIQPADIQELLDKGSKVVVLSRGMKLAVQTWPETLRLLNEKGIDVHVEETKESGRPVQQAGRKRIGGPPLPLHLLSRSWLADSPDY